MILLINTMNNDRFAVACGKKKMAEARFVNLPFKQSELLLSEIDQLVELQDLKGIIVASGPGGFSSLRIGIATANALAFALKIKVVGVKIEPEWLKLDDEERLKEVWSSGVLRLKEVKKGAWVMPEYDREPNINVK